MKPNELKNIVSEEIERVIQQEAGKIELSKLNENKYRDVSDKFKDALDRLPDKAFTTKNIEKLIKKMREKRPDAAMAYTKDAFGWLMKESINEVRVKKGDAIQMQDGEYGVVNKVKGRVAYIKLNSNPGSFHPIEAARITYKGKHKGRDLYSESKLNEEKWTLYVDKAKLKTYGSKRAAVVAYNKILDSQQMQHITSVKITKEGKINEAPQVAPQKRMEFGVEYKDSKGKPKKDNPLIKRFKTKAQADKYAKKGNQVDKVGGKYTVVQVPIEENVAPDHDGKAAPFGSGYKKVKDLEESTKAYEKALQKMARDNKLKMLSKSDKEKLIKIAQMLKKANESVNEGVITERTAKDTLKDAVNALTKTFGGKKIDKRYVKDYLKSMERMARKKPMDFVKDYGDFKVADWIEDAEYNLRNEGKLNESMIGIKTKANFKPLQLKGALEKAGIKGFKMDRLSVTLTALKLDKKYFNTAKKIVDKLGLSVMMAKESVNEATSLWKHFDAKMKLQDTIMDLEYDMKMINKDLSQLHKDMEQEAEPEGGPKATRYGRDIEKKEKEYKKKKAEFKKLMAKLDRMEQF